jgi:hypothetical protein
MTRAAGMPMESPAARLQAPTTLRERGLGNNQ